jgi:hypothetical protein
MAYIKKIHRDGIDKMPIGSAKLKTPEELRYALLQLCIGYWLAHGETMEVALEAVGSLDAIKAELTRTKVAPQMEQSKFDNGGADE